MRKSKKIQNIKRENSNKGFFRYRDSLGRFRKKADWNRSRKRKKRKHFLSPSPPAPSPPEYDYIDLNTSDLTSIHFQRKGNYTFVIFDDLKLNNKINKFIKLNFQSNTIHYVKIYNLQEKELDNIALKLTSMELKNAKGIIKNIIFKHTTAKSEKKVRIKIEK